MPISTTIFAAVRTMRAALRQARQGVRCQFDDESIGIILMATWFVAVLLFVSGPPPIDGHGSARPILYYLIETVLAIGIPPLYFRRSHPAALVVMTNVFFVSAVLTIAVVIVAKLNHALSTTGEPTGPAAPYLTTALGLALDAQSEMKFMLGLLALVLVPQLFSYLFAGFYGCAGPVVLARVTTRFSVGSIAKAISAAGGTIVGITAIYRFEGWPSFSAQALELTLTGIVFQGIGLAVLVALLFCDDGFERLKKSKAFVPFLGAHDWFTRCTRKEIPIVPRPVG